MDDYLKKMRDELALDYVREEASQGRTSSCTDFSEGFDAAVSYLAKREKILVEALEFYADIKSWNLESPCVEYGVSHRNQVSPSDLELTEKDVRLCAGKRARKALKKYRGEK